jgi:aspartyl protease family protein
VKRPVRAWLAVRALLALVPLAAAAQGVSLAGQMGSKALLVIDGQAQTLDVGETARGVKLLKLSDDTALVERGGAQSTLRLGAAPSRIGGVRAAAGGREIVIPAGPGGHFITAGTINGRPVQFMVDTGATLVALGQADAERLGLDWRSGQRAMMQTANGAAPALLLTLNAVRVGDVELANVQAVVMPMAMPHVLLGNSFLSRLQMRRDNDVMRLELK